MADDDSGFREFMDLRYGDLLRIAYLLTGSAHDAEDLVQSALLKVMRRWHRVDEPFAYQRRAMANAHISLWHRVRSRELVGGGAPEPADDDTADRVVRRQAMVAALRGWPVGTVKSHAARSARPTRRSSRNWRGW